MRCICHPSLRRFARYLRMLGIDTVCLPEETWTQMATGTEKVIFFTNRSSVSPPEGAYRITALRVREQAREARRIVHPYICREQILSRCLDCNDTLLPVARNEVEHKVPEHVFHEIDTFTSCPSCGKIYWRGTHSAAMESLISDIFGIPSEDP